MACVTRCIPETIRTPTRSRLIPSWGIGGQEVTLELGSCIESSYQQPALWITQLRAGAHCRPAPCAGAAAEAGAELDRTGRADDGAPGMRPSSLPGRRIHQLRRF